MSKLSEEKLIGWLCMAANAHDQDEGVCFMPYAIMNQLIERGWYERGDDNWNGAHFMTLTDSGRTIFELNAGDWGIPLLAFEADGGGHG